MVNEKELTEDFATALETFTAEQAAEAAASEDRVIKGTVVKITSTHAVVDAGFKSEGLVPIAEVQDHEGNVRFQPGDEIEVMVDKGETEEGYTRLSHQKAQRLRAWDEIEKAYNEKTPIQAARRGKNQGWPDRRYPGRSRLPARLPTRCPPGAQPGRLQKPSSSKSA